jgi:hypothetical protein
MKRQGTSIRIANDVLNADRYEELQIAAGNSTSKESNTLLTYEYFTNRFSTIDDISRDDLLYAIHVAYSWMPTTLKLLNISEIGQLDHLIPHITSLRKIRTFDHLLSQEKNASSHLLAISQTINNSIVGTSKVLHFFSPLSIPIIDSRVILAWNRFFSDHPSLQLVGCKPTVPVTKYIGYWKTLLYWKQQIGLDSIRELESAFFVLGGVQKEDVG